jgi:hypothetical protein
MGGSAGESRCRSRAHSHTRCASYTVAALQAEQRQGRDSMPSQSTSQSVPCVCASHCTVSVQRQGLRETFGNRIAHCLVEQRAHSCI